MRAESGEYIDTGTYVRQHYKVPAEIDGRVVANGKPGTIVGFDGAHVLIRLDGEEHANPWHPIWEMVYEAPHLREIEAAERAVYSQADPTTQDQEWSVTDEIADKAWTVWREQYKAPYPAPYDQLRTTLAAVAPDVAAGAARAERQRIVSYLREFKSHPVVLGIADAIAARDEEEPGD